MNKRLVIIFFLGFSSGLPLSLVSSTLQAWYAEQGMSFFITGSLSLLSLPYVFRIAWAPFLDRFPLSILGKRRSWMLCMQGLLLISFNLMSWFSPQAYPIALLVLGCCSAVFSATQDLAIDAHRTEYLLPIERGLGASIAVLGYRLGLLLSGGVALLIAVSWGWSVTYRVMGFLMILGMLTAYYSPEPSSSIMVKTNLKETFFLPIKELISRAGITNILFFILFYKCGEAFTTTISGVVTPFLIQGMGFSLSSIAYINKMLGVGSIVLGGLAAGFLLMRWSLYQCLLAFGILQALSNLLFVLLSLLGKNLHSCVSIIYNLQCATECCRRH